MKGFLQHIVVLLAAVVMSVSCSDRAEVIPRSKLAAIYAEMLMTDQWINARTDVRRIADTSLVYEPILQKYGYDHMDYLKTVDEYMDDPERFSRILRESGDIIGKKLKGLRRELEERKRLEALKLRIEKMTIKSDFQADEFFPYMFDEPYVHYYDSLVIEIDSVIQHYRFRDMPTTDTLYEGIRMISPLDSLALADSLAVADSLAMRDSLVLSGLNAVRDSIMKAHGISKIAAPVKGNAPMKLEGGAKKMTTDQKKKLPTEQPKKQAVKIAEDEILFD